MYMSTLRKLRPQAQGYKDDQVYVCVNLATAFGCMWDSCPCCLTLRNRHKSIAIESALVVVIESKHDKLMSF